MVVVVVVMPMVQAVEAGRNDIVTTIMRMMMTMVDRHLLGREDSSE
jgi:hypothetical protein